MSIRFEELSQSTLAPRTAWIEHSLRIGKAQSAGRRDDMPWPR